MAGGDSGRCVRGCVASCRVAGRSRCSSVDRRMRDGGCDARESGLTRQCSSRSVQGGWPMTVGAVEARFAGEPRRCTAKRTDQRGRRRIVYGLLLSLLIASAACSKRKAVDAAEDAARDWLALVDAGEYERAWEQASSGMRQREAKDEWVNATSQARAAVPGASTRLVYDRVVAKDSTEDHMLVNLVFRAIVKCCGWARMIRRPFPSARLPSSLSPDGLHRRNERLHGRAADVPRRSACATAAVPCRAA